MQTLPPGSISRDNRIAYWFAAILIAALGVLHIVLVRGIYADGAWFLHNMLHARSFWLFDSARRNAQIVYELPVVGAIWAGADNIKFLARVQTVGLVLPVVLLYLGALWKVRANEALFGAFVLIVVAVHQTLNFMAIGEYNLLYAMVTFSLAVLVQDKEPTILDCVLMAACGLVAARCYEAMVVLGPMLVAACVLRLRGSEASRPAKIALGAATLVFAAGSALAVLFVLYPRSTGNLHAAIHGLYRTNIQMWLSGVLAAAYAGAMLFGSRAVRLAMIAVFVVALVALAIPATWAIPRLHYISRALGGAFLFAIGATLIAVRFSPLYQQVTTRAGIARMSVIAPLLALTVSAAPDVHHSIGWKRFLNSFEREVNAGTGLIPFEEANNHLKKEKLYGWRWTYPTMSVLLRHGPDHAIILNPESDKAWRPFDPEDEDSIPKIADQYTWK